jgi:hypothetical protein
MRRKESGADFRLAGLSVNIRYSKPDARLPEKAPDVSASITAVVGD